MDPGEPLQRSKTLPARLRHSLGSVDGPSPGSNEVLFHHHSAKIVKFELPNSTHIAPPSDISSDLDYVVDAVETLPWRLSTERTVAVGYLKIEQVPGSTMFLKSGDVVRALMKNCQCWCVDGNSTFVIRIQRLTYYRIELPFKTEQDKEQVETLKQVLRSIIRYEVTPCPFKRGFSVELPEEARTPRKKKAWRPKLDPSVEVGKLSFGEAGSDGVGCGRSDTRSTHADSEDGAATDGSENTPKARRAPTFNYEGSPSVPTPARAVRNVTEPTCTFDSIMARFQALPDSESETDGDTLSSSMDSFHSFKSARSGLPSPPYSDPPSPLDSRPLDNVKQLQIPPKPIHTRELSEATVVVEPVGLEEAAASWKENRSLEADRVSSSPGHMNGITTSMLTTSPGTVIRQRCLQGPKRHELPPTQSSTSWSTEGGSPVNKMTASILRKTCSLIVGTPIQVLAIILHIAARLAHGGESRATNTDESDNHYDGSDSDDGIWSEDDFGIPLSTAASVKAADPSIDNGHFELWEEELD
ncbi:Inp1 superfamily domain-containing protein [Histoplasma ohiense]|nr:Inp1 superfamily domain-containing protein [Histoplasma ohiense (nom. inval.)]